MTAFQQLYDSNAGVYYIIDGKSMIFKITSDKFNKEIRLKPHFSAMLLALFLKHPEAVSYEMMTNILRENNFVCSDETRLHRKVSELRRFLSKFHFGLDGLILNTRGIGYSLPLYLKRPEIIKDTNYKKVGNKRLQVIINLFQQYIVDSLSLSKKCSIVKSVDGFILQRKPVHQEIEQLLNQYEQQKLKLFAELRLHSSDFIAIRLEFTLAKLKTYLGLVRISEFSITKDQWLEWHEYEVGQVLGELVSIVGQV